MPPKKKQPWQIPLPPSPVPEKPAADPVPERKFAPQTRLATGVRAREIRGFGGETVESTAQEVPPGSGVGRVFGYLRRSAEDRRGKPLSAQAGTITEYVVETMGRKDPEFARTGVAQFFFDNGVGGTADPYARPGMRAMIETVEKTKNAHVVVFDTSRLARSLEVGTKIKSILERTGTTLHLAYERTVVEGASQEMVFGIALQMYASERTSAITRVKTAFRFHKDWDPRKSFGWSFEGSGHKPVPIPEEQEMLKEIQTLFERGDTTKSIAKAIQEAHGSRRVRKVGAEPESKIAWTGTDVSFLAKKHAWKWGGGKTQGDLIRETSAAVGRGENLEAFLKNHSSDVYDGVKINRPMLRKHFPEELPEWQSEALRLVRHWTRSGRHSIDDIAVMLTDKSPREGTDAWSRQTTWRLVKEAERLNALEEERRRL